MTDINDIENTDKPQYSQEEATANALFYAIKALEFDGIPNAEVGRAIQAAKDWTSAINTKRYDFSKNDPTPTNPDENNEQQQPAAEPARIVATPPAQNA